MAEVRGKKLLFRNLCPSVTEDQLQVIINEVDDIDDSEIVHLDLSSVGETSVALVTLSSVAAADTVLEILHDTPLGPDFSSIEVTFALHEDVAKLENRKQTTDQVESDIKLSAISDSNQKVRSTNQKSSKKFVEIADIGADSHVPSSGPQMPSTTRTPLHMKDSDTKKMSSSGDLETGKDLKDSSDTEGDPKPKPNSAYQQDPEEQSDISEPVPEPAQESKQMKKVGNQRSRVNRSKNTKVSSGSHPRQSPAAKPDMQQPSMNVNNRQRMTNPHPLNNTVNQPYMHGNQPYHQPQGFHGPSSHFSDRPHVKPHGKGIPPLLDIRASSTEPPPNQSYGRHKRQQYADERDYSGPPQPQRFDEPAHRQKHNGPPYQALDGPPHPGYDRTPNQRYDGPPDQRYNGPPDQRYNGPRGQRYDGPPDQRYNGPPDQRYNGPRGQRYNGPPDQRYNGPPDQRYNGPPDQRYHGPPNQRYNGPPNPKYHEPNYGSGGPSSNPNYGRSPQHHHEEPPDQNFNRSDRRPHIKSFDARDDPQQYHNTRPPSPHEGNPRPRNDRNQAYRGRASDVSSRDQGAQSSSREPHKTTQNRNPNRHTQPDHPGARAKQGRGKLPVTTETTSDKMSRMYGTPDHGQWLDDSAAHADSIVEGANDDDDNNSIFSGHSSASRTQAGSRRTKTPTSTSINVTGFDRSVSQASFQAFLRELGVNFITVSFQRAYGNQNASAIVRFKTTRETTNGKKLVDNALMKTVNNGSNRLRLRASYIYPDQERRSRGPMKAPPSNYDNTSDVGSATPSHYKSDQRQSTVLKVTGKERTGIDPTLLNSFLQQKNISTLTSEFISENQKLYALLHFESPKDCTGAKSQLFGKCLAIGQTPVAVSYVNPQTSETTHGGASAPRKSHDRRARSDSRGRRRKDKQVPSANHPGNGSYQSQHQRSTQFVCVRVTAIVDCIDEDTFQRFLRRKQIQINNMKWSESAANLYFSSEAEANKAQEILNGCELVVGDIAMKAEIMSSVSITNSNRRKQKAHRQVPRTNHQNNNDVSKDDASSDVSSVDSCMRNDQKRQGRLATSVQVTNFNPGVDEDALRQFLLDVVEVDFSELQFFGRTAVLRFHTTDEARKATELIKGKSLGNGKKRLRATQKGPPSDTKEKKTKLEDAPKAWTASQDKTNSKPQDVADKVSNQPLKDHSAQLNGNPNDVIVDDIPRFVRESDLAELVSESSCEGFRNSVISQDVTTNKRLAVLTFDTRAHAVEAMAALYGKRLKGFCMNVTLAQEQHDLGNLIARKKIQTLLGEIEDNRTKVASELESRMNDLALQVTEIDENLNECDSIKEAISLEEHKIAVRQQIDEIQDYQREFEQVYSRLIQPKLELLQPSNTSSVNLGELDDLRQRFLRECRRIRNPLPIYGHKALILETITASDTNACVIRAETGSGKSTQVPQYLIEDVDFLTTSSGPQKKNIICTQPRRVAAISLAKRVAEEYGCKVGEEVGYVVGNRRTTTPRTLLTFMTDGSLLNMCLSDGLDNCACVIIDEAHERSVDTDILLAMLKGIQAQRSDLKIIIMSATIDVDLFSKYLHNCPVISVPGRTFPVDTIWCGSGEPSGSGDYTMKAVEKVKEIHKKADSQGDILVFLTSQKEIEEACNQAERGITDGSALVLPLHGKLQPDDQMKVFKETPFGKRKIVFATNVAETSVTIPGIRYVIDTGVVKECQYDPQRNMSLLKVTTITQSSAEQRKGRAGRTGPGVCYRLYAKSEYEEMEQSMKPEILRVHLGMAMLQLMKMGVQDVTKFDFVESPEKAAIEQAMQSLIYLGAVSGQNQLTPVGLKMAALPLEPRLAKLVLSGIANNLGEIAVIVAALVSAPGNIIYRGSSDKDQQTADLMKMRFSSEGGDILTMLKIYNTWLSIGEKDRNGWCKRNSMNAKTLRMVKENVNEITQILKKSLSLTIEKTEVAEDDEDLIKKILTSVYFENLCVFNGHARAGYTILAQQKTAIVHPSSVLKTLGSHPKWLIYGDLRRTTQDFICVLTPFEAQWIDEVIPKSFKDKIDIESLDKNVMKECKIENIGTALMKDLARKRFEKLRGLEDVITEETSVPCIIETDWEAGCLNVFIAGHAHNYARQKINAYLEEMKTQAYMEQREIPVGLHGSVRHVVVAGGETGFVLMKDEYRSLDISNVPQHLEVDELLQLCGSSSDQVKDVFKFPSHWQQAKRGDWGRVTFLKPSDAQQAKVILESTIYPEGPEGEEVQHISAQPSLPRQERGIHRLRPVIETAVEVTWFLGRARGIAFISCDTSAEALTLISDVDGLPIREKAIRASLKKDNSRIVYVNGVDLQVTQEEMEKTLKKTTRVAFNSVSIPRNKPTMSINNATVKKQLQRCFDIDSKARLDINILDARSEKSQRRKGFMNFDPSLQHQIKEKLEELDSIPLYTATQEMYHFRMLVTTALYCTQHIYGLLKEQINELIGAAEQADDDITIKITEMKQNRDHGRQRISISGSDYQKVLDVRSAMQVLLNGEQILVEELAGENKPEQWVQRSLMNLTQERVQECIGDTTAFMEVDSRRGVVQIYGKKEDREELKNVLQNYFFSLTQTKLKEMRLPPGILRALIRQYGPWLEDLKEETAVEEITIYLKRGVLMITGSEEAQNNILEKIKDCSNGTTVNENSAEDNDCGICFCPADPDAKTYRLLSCGHYYCLGCLQDFLKHSVTDKTFPIVCPSEDCTERLMLVDIRFIYPQEEKQNQLFRAALEAYVAQKSKENELKFCPTPDCCMIYKQKADTGGIWTCTECGHQICSACGQEPHPKGMSCAEYRISKQSSDAIWIWRRTTGSNVKQCPTPDCGIIEKFEGCNHVQCPQCKKHICWTCLALFDGSEECYAHLSAAHGGCFDYV